jgi:hypothetical protein
MAWHICVYTSLRKYCDTAVRVMPTATWTAAVDCIPVDTTSTARSVCPQARAVATIPVRIRHSATRCAVHPLWLSPLFSSSPLSAASRAPYHLPPDGKVPPRSGTSIWNSCLSYTSLGVVTPAVSLSSGSRSLRRPSSGITSKDHTEVLAILIGPGCANRGPNASCLAVLSRAGIFDVVGNK